MAAATREPHLIQALVSMYLWLCPLTTSNQGYGNSSHTGDIIQSSRASHGSEAQYLAFS